MANTAAPLIVAVNAGSSSLKVAAYGEVTDAPAFTRGVQAGTGAPWLINWLTKTVGRKSVCLIGHRIVASRPGPPVEEVTPSLLAELQRATSDDPIHLPVQLALIEAVAAALPRARQFVCSDSAFHSTIPPAGRHLPLPRRFDDVGIERIGFHGLSCASVVAQLWKTIGYKATAGRLIIAHLGSGASVTALLNCESRDTSMGFSPDGGLMMASRPGDLDPGVLLAILRRGQHSTVAPATPVISASSSRVRPQIRWPPKRSRCSAAPLRAPSLVPQPRLAGSTSSCSLAALVNTCRRFAPASAPRCNSSRR